MSEEENQCKYLLCENYKPDAEKYCYKSFGSINRIGINK